MLIQNNSVAKFVSSRRWIRRLNLFTLPQKVWVRSAQKTLFVSSQDLKGPSYHVLNWGVDSYETKNINFLERFLKTFENPVFLDIGANVGIFTFQLACRIPHLVAHAFEPERVSFSCIQSTFTDKAFPNVHVHNLAVSDEDQEIPFFSDSENHGGHSLYKEMILGEKNTVGESYIVKAIAMDPFLKKQQLPKIHGVKIDIQGHEAAALKGFAETLGKDRPLVMMECLMKDLLVADSPLLAPFKDNEYLALLPETGESVEIALDSFQKLSEAHSYYVDVAFVPKEYRSRVK